MPVTAVSRRSYRWIALGISGVLLVSVAAFIVYTRVETGIAASVEHKSAKSTTATVVSVTELRPVNPSEEDKKGQRYKVCFTVDNFDEVEANMRQGYQAAETQRLARDGPRCKVTAKVTPSKHLSNGDKLTVVYLLENEYQIDVVRTTAFGEEL